MANIVDYLKWRGDITLKQNPFNEVDNLILSELSYIEISKKNAKKPITIKKAIHFYLEKYSEEEIVKKFAFSQNPLSFFECLANSKRFGNLKILNYVNKVSKKEEKQFSAMMIKLNVTSLYVAFKGTDETLVGWKEDFNMGFMEEIPSQKEAVNYVNHRISFQYRHIILGGHSKGGNLAVYSGVKCKKSIQKRIKKIYTNDGPGFTESFTQNPIYSSNLSKIVALEPVTSIIGMLLTQKNEYKVVQSDSKGLWQHDPLTWQVEGTSFLTLDEVDETSNKIKNTITNWLSLLDNEKRKIFINTLFQVLEKNEIYTIDDLVRLKLKTVSGLLKTFTKLDEDTRKIMIETLKVLMKEANKYFDRKTIWHSFKAFNKKSS